MEINLTLKRTNVLLFNGKHKGKSEKISIKINQTAITQVPEKRLLGVIIEGKVSFKPHINYISLQARKSFSRLAAFPSLTPATLVTIYKSFIRSRIKYCCSAWSHKLYSNNNFKNLEPIQKGALPLILRPLKSTSTSSLEAQLKVTSATKLFLVIK